MSAQTQVSAEEVHVVFDDNVEQNVPKTWVAQRTRAWDLVVEIGSVVDVHFEVGEDGRRSTSTDIGVVCVCGRPGVGAMAHLCFALGELEANSSSGGSVGCGTNPRLASNLSICIASRGV